MEDTLECMEALMKQSYRDFRIYLVDNGSTDESPTVLSKKYGTHPKVSLILNKENFGFTKGNNEVLIDEILANPSYKYVALLNNDTEPTEYWLDNLVSAAEREQAAMVSSKMIDYFERDKMDNAGHLMLNTGEILPIGHRVSIKKYNNGFENMGACAGAALYSIAMLKDIGVFDEYFDTGYEDAELGVRTVLSGYKCWYEPTAVVYHKMGQSIKKIFNYKYALRVQKNILYTYFKLIPLGVIIFSLPFLMFRYFSMITACILFGQWQYARILFNALQETFIQDRKLVLEARKDVSPKVSRISSFSFLKRQVFFLRVDLLRFYRFILLRRKSAMDTYGKAQRE